MNILITSSPNASKIMSELIIAEAELNALRQVGVFEYEGEIIAPTIKQRANNRHSVYQLEFPKRKRKFTGPLNDQGQPRRLMSLSLLEYRQEADELIEKTKRSEKAKKLEKQVNNIRAALTNNKVGVGAEQIIEENIFETIGYLEYELAKNVVINTPPHNRLKNQLPILQSKLNLLRKAGIFEYEGKVIVPTIKKQRSGYDQLEFPVINGVYTGPSSKRSKKARRFVRLQFNEKPVEASRLIEKMKRSEEAEKVQDRIKCISAILAAQEQSKQKELEIEQAKKQYIIDAIAYLENELAKMESA